MEAFGLTLKVGFFQFTPLDLMPEKNLQVVIDGLLEGAEMGANLILLPELWSCGLLRTRKEAQAQAQTTEALLKEISPLCHERGMFVAGSLPELEENGSIFNTLYVVGPDGFLGRYRKIHLFPLLDEEKIFEPGTRPRDIWIHIQDQEVGLGCLICFDLRFPELSRLLTFRGIDILICPALWPEARREHFETLLMARAMENQCFLIAANTCGNVSGVTFAGSSSVIAPDGEVLAHLATEPGIAVTEIDLGKKAKARKTFFTARPTSGWAYHMDEKIMSLEELVTVTTRRKKAGQKMVFTNGCFDILHAGHVSYLKKARLQGDFLVVGLNSDSSIRAIKGKERPINPQWQRASLLSSLEVVDYVVIFHENDPERLIRALKPDVLVKGEDWEEDQIVGADFVKSTGGEVKRVRFDVAISTTEIIEKIRWGSSH